MKSIKLVPTSYRGGKIVLQARRSHPRGAYTEKIGFFNFETSLGYKIVVIDRKSLAVALLFGASISNARLRKVLSSYGAY